MCMHYFGSAVKLTKFEKSWITGTKRSNSTKKPSVALPNPGVLGL